MIILYILIIISGIESRNLQNINFAIDYFKNYGYISESRDLNTENNIDLTQTIVQFQKFTNLPRTGELDDTTMAMLRKKRCGNPDFSPASRKKRFAVHTSWGKNNLLWNLSNKFLDNFNKTEIEKDLMIAFKKWEEYSSLKILKINNGHYSDIKISFEEKNHNDGYNFDNLNILAHAFFPKNGRIHLNKDVNWNVKNNIYANDNTDFYSVILHEIGHVLGLSHSSSFESVMYPWYSLKNKTQNLSLDDIYGINQLYPSKKKKWSKSVFRLYTYKTILQNKLYYFLPDNKVISVNDNYKIFDKKDKWDNIFFDSVYQRPNGDIMFFYGQSYLIYDASSLYNNKPLNALSGGLLTELGFPKHVKKIKVAFRLNNQTYFVYNRDYWIFNETTFKINKRNYNRIIKPCIFENINNKLILSVIDKDDYVTVFTLNNTYYFMKRKGTMYSINSIPYTKPQYLRHTTPRATAAENVEIKNDAFITILPMIIIICYIGVLIALLILL